MRLKLILFTMLALALSAAALGGCRASAANPAASSGDEFSAGPASLTGPYSLVGWTEPVRMGPQNASWSIELPSGGWWDSVDEEPFDSGLTPVNVTYRTPTGLDERGRERPYVSVNVLTLASLPDPECGGYNTLSPSGEPISERLADMQLGEHTARVDRVTAAPADGSSSGTFSVCFVANGVKYNLLGGASPALAQVDLFKMLRTFRLDG